MTAGLDGAGRVGGHPLAIITGASSGIGAASARALAGAGYRVVLVARSAEKLQAVADNIGALAHVEACDASDGQAVLAMVARVGEKFGTPDLLVNSAGLGAWKRIEETTPQEGLEMLKAPYLAAFNMTHAVMSGMLSLKRGVIIHVGSPASMSPWPASVGYAASRAALRGMHEALCADLHSSGVHSCHVVFGRVKSPYFANNEHAADRVPGIGAVIRTITPEECGAVILKTALNPRREVRYPFALRSIYWLNAVVPGLLRWLLRITGHQHQKA
jgi:uncharacterized protein